MNWYPVWGCELKRTFCSLPCASFKVFLLLLLFCPSPAGFSRGRQCLPFTQSSEASVGVRGCHQTACSQDETSAGWSEVIHGPKPLCSSSQRLKPRPPRPHRWNDYYLIVNVYLNLADDLARLLKNHWTKIVIFMCIFQQFRCFLEALLFSTVVNLDIVHQELKPKYIFFYF